MRLRVCVRGAATALALLAAAAVGGQPAAPGLTADFEVVASRESAARPLRWPMARARLRP